MQDGDDIDRLIEMKYKKHQYDHIFKKNLQEYTFELIKDENKNINEKEM